ncbi:uncharacterized protein SPSK_01248 [Sporothrix schenckii 1099-18]|uniref:Uncharacterized protein n=1 Tax=Sporothrix schenckii 1099-18 TaxID=1397361 RepID=A0A0F2LX27_SPOSC|nr:uncharacterized protein SPSK_01248 [Sporothrix schenckii 1099-18]KJR81414.1 hypothetical protein SPSK_01248 [Sporothrix schenckii 1099-18]
MRACTDPDEKKHNTTCWRAVYLHVHRRRCMTVMVMVMVMATAGQAVTGHTVLRSGKQRRLPPATSRLGAADGQTVSAGACGASGASGCAPCGGAGDDLFPFLWTTAFGRTMHQWLTRQSQSTVYSLQPTRGLYHGRSEGIVYTMHYVDTCCGSEIHHDPDLEAPKNRQDMTEMFEMARCEKISVGQGMESRSMRSRKQRNASRKGSTSLAM